jgi:hypothetical protein
VPDVVLVTKFRTCHGHCPKTSFAEFGYKATQPTRAIFKQSCINENRQIFVRTYLRQFVCMPFQSLIERSPAPRTFAIGDSGGTSKIGLVRRLASPRRCCTAMYSPGFALMIRK